MKKALCCTEYVIYIIVIHLATFVLRPMSWTVLSIRLFKNEPYGIEESIGNLIIFICIAFVIALFFKLQNQLMPVSELFKTFFRKSLWLVLLIRFLTDFIQLSLLSVRSAWEVGKTAAMFIEAFSLFAAFAVMKKTMAQGKIHRSKKKIYVLSAGAVILVGILVFHGCCCHVSLAETQYILSKYTDPSFVFEADTADFRLQLIGLLFSIVLWIMLFFYFDLFGSYCRRNAEPYKGTKLIVRLTCLIITVVIGMGAKMLLWPIGSLDNYENISTQNHSVKKGINDIYSITAISRKLNYTESELVYKNTRVTLRYGEQPILKFSRKINQEEGRLQKISLSETDLAYRYDFDAVAYVNNGSAFAIELKNINSYKKEDRCLIKICEQLVGEGYFEAFEYTYQYLLNYDREFITPYIENYTRGNFDDSFYQKNKYIKADYITQVLRDIEV